ncbi:MAG: alpha/beta fold hydrolase [Clostridia bacterium]|nr:alpha/beta fold hydrolase [Clostridia bacterium]
MKRILCVALTLVLVFPVLTIAEETYTAHYVFSLLQSEDYDALYALFGKPMRAGVKTKEDIPSYFPLLGEPVRFGIETTTIEESFGESCRKTVIPFYYEDNVVIFQVYWQDNLIVGMFQGTIPMEKVSLGEIPEGIREDGVCVGDMPLFGLVTVPEERSALLPAVVLLHGSGPADMDEAVGNTKMFRDLAHGFAQKGIASLRYYKRTYVYGNEYSAEEIKLFTVREESINDAVTAAQILRTDPRIDPERIYLVGHSMGAMLAPRIAQENPGLFAGIILLSGTPKTLADIVLSQNQALVDAMSPLEKIVGNMQMAALRQSWKDVLKGSAEEAKGKTVFGQPAYYFWEMAQYDTAEILKTLDIPVLIINGGADFQVIDADGIDAWRAAELPENVQLSYYPSLNHLLMNPDAPDSMRGTTKEYDIPCHVSEEVIDEVAAFILN